MAGPQQSAEVLVLARRPTGERFVRLSCFERHQGALAVLWREPAAKSPAGTLPDLFDHALVELESGRGGGHFAREYRLLHRHEGLATSYRALQEASAWMRILEKNLPFMHSQEELFELTLTALRRWEEEYSPIHVALKLYYIYAREEGFPVKEEWQASLDGEELESLGKILHNSLSTFSSPHQEQDSALLQKLKEWLKASSEWED